MLSTPVYKWGNAIGIGGDKFSTCIFHKLLIFVVRNFQNGKIFSSTASTNDLFRRDNIFKRLKPQLLYANRPLR